MIANRRVFIVFLSIVAAGILLFTVVSGGYYPIGMVDRTFIMSRQFRKDYRAISLSYWNTVKLYQPESENEQAMPKSTDVQAAVLDRLIETILVRAAVKDELGDDFDRLLANKVDKFDGDAELQAKSLALYGLAFPDIKQEILVPQAEQDLLSGRLFMRGETLETWLLEAKKKSTVRIFSKTFHWEDGKVKIHE